MKDKLFLLSQYLVPQHLLSRFIGFFANCRWCWFKNRLISWFIKRYQVNMSLAAESDPKKYPTFNKFFTRKLDLAQREIQGDESHILCPVDGTISQFGHIENNQIFQAKGHYYTLEALLGNKSLAELFIDGEFITLYLSPKDYHRIHMPIAGTLQQMTYIPGKLFSVNSITTAKVPELFAKNERAVCIFETKLGPVAVIPIGAMIVASINTVWAGKITPNRDQTIQHYNYTDLETKISLKQVDELGHFELGSTVILLLPKNVTTWEPLSPGQSIQMGKTLANA